MLRVNGDMLLPSTGSPHPGSNDLPRLLLLSKAESAHAPDPIPLPNPMGRAPTARDWERDREAFAPALGGELGSGMGSWLEGEVEGEEDGEKVGKGDVDRERDGCSSMCSR